MYSFVSVYIYNLFNIYSRFYSKSFEGISAKSYNIFSGVKHYIFVGVKMRQNFSANPITFVYAIKLMHILKCMWVSICNSCVQDECTILKKNFRDCSVILKLWIKLIPLIKKMTIISEQENFHLNFLALSNTSFTNLKWY